MGANPMPDGATTLNLRTNPTKASVDDCLDAADAALSLHLEKMDVAYKAFVEADYYSGEVEQRLGEVQIGWDGKPGNRRVKEPYPKEYQDAVDRRDELDEVWQQSINDRDELIDAMLSIPTATPHQAIRKLEVAASALELRSLDDLKSATEEDVVRLFHSAVRDLRRFNRDGLTFAAPTGAEFQWNARLVAYEQMQAAYDATLNRPCHTRRRWLELPDEFASRNIHHGRFERWKSLEDLRADILLSDAEKAQLEPVVAKVIAETAAAEKAMDAAARQIENDDDEAQQVLYDRLSAAERELLDTPAPHVEALVYKQRIIAREADDDKMGFADVGAFSAHLAGYYVDYGRALVYQDSLRLAGMDDPVLHLTPFSPNSWWSAFEGLGGVVTHYRPWEMAILLPEGDRDGRAAAMLAELEAAPWKYRALFLGAEGRRSYGGDPLYDSQWKRRVPRPGIRTEVKARYYRNALRVTFITRHGVPTPVVEPIHHDKPVKFNAPERD
jgi:hypothetical protein